MVNEVVGIANSVLSKVPLLLVSLSIPAAPLPKVRVLAEAAGRLKTTSALLPVLIVTGSSPAYSIRWASKSMNPDCGPVTVEMTWE